MSSASKGKKPHERRRAGRVRCGLTTCQFGTVVNISKSGMRVVSRKLVPTMPPGASIQLMITAAGRSMAVPGRPVHNRPRPDGTFEVGFQFAEITEAQARELIELARTAFDSLVIYTDRLAS